jgi:ribosomal protein S18 acetylase RimI-like enzyme
MSARVSPGYRYHIPATEGPAFTVIEVAPLVPQDGSGYDGLAAQSLQIQAQNLMDAYASMRRDLDTDQIVQAVDPRSSKLVSREADRLRDAGRTALPGFQARFAAPETAPESEEQPKIAGLGLATDVRTDKHTYKLVRDLSETGAAAAINIAVRPDSQGRGVGTVLLHALLKSLPEDTLLVGHAFSLTRPQSPLFDRFGLKPVGAQATELLGGEKFNRNIYSGAAGGAVLQVLEQAVPRLRTRELIET